MYLTNIYEEGRVKSVRKIALKNDGLLTLKAFTGTPMKLTPEEARVMYILDLYQQEGKASITMQEIYENLGYTGYFAQMRGPLLRWLQSMNGLQAIIESDAYNYNGSLLPIQKIQYENQPNFVVEFLGAMPLLEYMRAIDSYAKVDPVVFKAPLNRTGENMALEHCLLRKITLNDGDEGEIYFEGLNGAAGTHYIQRDLAYNAERLFEYYKACKLLSDYQRDINRQGMVVGIKFTK